MNHELVLHSVSYSGSWGQHFLSPEQFLDKAAELGYDGVMLMAKRPHLSVLDWNPAARERLRSRSAKLRLRVACLAGYTNFTADLEHRDIPTREFQIRHVVELAEMARDLGCNLIRIFTGYESPSATLDAQTKIIVESLRECAERTADLGVTIGVQNHHDVACDYESLFEIIQEVNALNCRAMFDAWAPALQGVDLEAAAAKMAKITVYTTTANYAIRPRFRYHPTLVNYEKLLPTVQAVPMDEGFIDYRTFLANLGAAGFTGPVAYEMCSPLRGGGSIQNLDLYASKFLNYMHAQRDTRVLEAVE